MNLLRLPSTPIRLKSHLAIVRISFRPAVRPLHRPLAPPLFSLTQIVILILILVILAILIVPPARALFSGRHWLAPEILRGAPPDDDEEYDDHPEPVRIRFGLPSAEPPSAPRGAIRKIPLHPAPPRPYSPRFKQP